MPAKFDMALRVWLLGDEPQLVRKMRAPNLRQVQRVVSVDQIAKECGLQCHDGRVGTQAEFSRMQQDRKTG